MKRHAWTVVIIVVTVVAAVGATWLTSAMGRNTAIAAIVNGDVIYARAVSAEVGLVARQYGLSFEGKEGQAQREQFTRAIVDSLIDRRILMREARRLGLEATDQEVEQRLEEVRQNFGSPAEFQEALRNRGLTLVDLRDRIRIDATARKLRPYVTRSVAVGEQELQLHFEQNRAQFDRADQTRVRQIVLRSEPEARVMLGRLQRGEDFAALARQHSIDPAGRERGGDLGLVGRGQLPPEVEKAASTLKIGELSDLIRTVQGYHIIRVEERRGARPAQFEEVRDRIRQILTEQRQEKQFEAWLRDVKSRAKIVRLS
ncbi:MAG: peptidylprolyl isomerase [Armatimonadetes bacterium]|nr:peptidylprolyl isomerase [Armatimonadota bacterium]